MAKGKQSSHSDVPEPCCRADDARALIDLVRPINQRDYTEASPVDCTVCSWARTMPTWARANSRLENFPFERTRSLVDFLHSVRQRYCRKLHLVVLHKARRQRP